MTNKELLSYYRKEHNIKPKYVPCTLEEHMQYAALHEKGKVLPDGIRCSRKDDGSLVFEKADGFDISQEEINEILMHKQIELSESIDGSLRFFVILAVIGIIIGAISLISSCSAFL